MSLKRMADVVALFTVVSGLVALEVWWTARIQPLHGDLFYFESLYNDLFVRGHQLSQFAFTEATFTFPDFVLFALLRPWVTDPRSALMLYAVGFVSIYWTLLFVLYRRFTSRSPWFFILGLWALVALTGTTHFYKNTAFWPNHHGALQLVFLVLLVQLAPRAHASRVQFRIWLLVNFILAALMTFSDLLAVLGVLLPALVYCVYQRERREWATAASLGLGILAGQGIKTFALQQGWLIGVPFVVSKDDWPEIVASCSALPKALLEYSLEDWPVTVAFASLLALARWRKQPRAKGFRELALASLVVGGLGLMLSGRFPNSGLARYYQQFNFLPLIWIAVYGVAQLPLKRWQAIVATVAGMASLSVIIPHLKAPENILQEQPLSACLDAHAADLASPWGLSSFFISKVVTFTNHTHLHVNQFKKNLSYDPWMNSPLWYREDRFGNPIARHTFVISRDSAQTQLARATFGPPAQSFPCPYGETQVDVLIYPQGVFPLPPDNSQPN